MTNDTITIRVDDLDRLAAAAAAEGLSLRAYVTRTAEPTPQELARRGAQTREILKAWNGFDPTAEEAAELNAELDRRLAIARRTA